jgi:aspartate aminotransferase
MVMTIAKKIGIFMQQSSLIRKMFETGVRLKVEHGDDNVFDFSLGNPNLPPPRQFSDNLKEAASSCKLGDHWYMLQAGYPYVRQAVADYLTTEQGVTCSQNDIIMTCGAASALNVILKALLDPGDEVIVPTPWFVDYKFYIDNHDGRAVMVPTTGDFDLDIAGIEAAVTSRTKAVLINSPNNPTGRIYSAERLKQLGDMLRDKGRSLSRTLYLLSDEPYRKIVFDDNQTPSIFQAYEQSVIATSYSKDLSIPGERIGYAAVHPDATYKADIINAMNFTIRILGFINAPALMQRVVAGVQGASAEVSEYQRKRDMLCDGLSAAGYESTKPQGTFYLFLKAPIEDDMAFAKELQQELIIVTPGVGFAWPGYFRLAFCVDDRTITEALPGFKRVMDRYR